MKKGIRAAVFIVSIAAFSLIGSLLPQECRAAGIAVSTYIKLTSTGVKPEPGNENFTAYYKEGAETDPDNVIETEDTFNGTADSGYVSALGICRADITQVLPPESVTTGDSYWVWVTDTTTSESATVTGTVTATNPTWTNPGASAATALFLTSANYLAIPTGFAAVAGDGYVDLNWSAVSGVTGYRIYRSPIIGNGNRYVYERVGILTGGDTTKWRDTDVVDGTTYYYIMIATDATPRRSGHTEEVSATPHTLPTQTQTPTQAPTETP